MAQTAAFFDLDRTLLSGASGPVISRRPARRRASCPSRTIPGEGLVYGLFNRLRRDPAEHGARPPGRARGEGLAAAVRRRGREAGRRAPHRPRAAATPGALRRAPRRGPPAGARHHDALRPGEAAGRPARLRRRVVATRYGVADDGTYDGTIDGDVRVGERQARGRARRGPTSTASTSARATPTPTASTTRRCCRRSAIRSRSTPTRACGSWPLGAPLADAAPRRARRRPEAVARRRAAAGARWRSPRPQLVPYAALRHRRRRAHPDARARRSSSPTTAATSTPPAMAIAIAKRGRTVRFLGKKEVFDAPVVGQLAKAMGGIRVDRGTGSDEPLRGRGRGARRRRAGGDHAAGHDPPRSGVLRSRLKGRWGAARPRRTRHACAGDPGRALGHRAGVAAQRPPAERAERDRTRRTISVRVGPPVELKYKNVDADTKRIMEAIVDLLPAGSARAPRAHRTRSCAARYPPGYKGDPTRETSAPTRHRLTGGAVRCRVREAPIVERSEQEPAEAQRRTATRSESTPRAAQCAAGCAKHRLSSEASRSRPKRSGGRRRGVAEHSEGRRSAPPGARSTDCRAKRAGAGRSAAEDGDED